MTQSQSQLRTVEYPLEGMEGKTVVDMKCRHLLGSIRVDIGGTSHEIRRFLLGTEDHVAGIVEIAFQSGGAGVILQGYPLFPERARMIGRCSIINSPSTQKIMPCRKGSVRIG